MFQETAGRALVVPQVDPVRSERHQVMYNGPANQARGSSCRRCRHLSPRRGGGSSVARCGCRPSTPQTHHKGVHRNPSGATESWCRSADAVAQPERPGCRWPRSARQPERRRRPPTFIVARLNTARPPERRITGGAQREQQQDRNSESAHGPKQSH
jgi:hypothetical protein